MKTYSSASQPFAVRLVIFINVLFWGIQIPLGGSNIGPQLLITILFGLILGFRKKIISIKILLFSGVLAVYGTLSYLVGPCTDVAIKVVFSLIALLLVMISLSWLASAVRLDVPLVSVNEASAMLGLAAFIAIAEFILKLLTGTPLNELRVGGLYLEPSHWAFYFIRFFFFFWFSGSRLKATGFLLIFIVIGYSSTLIVLLGVMLGLAFCGYFLRRRLRLLDLFAIAALVVSATLSMAMFSSSDTFLRISDLIDLRQESNLSSLVYANGWQQLSSYLTSTSGIGLGVNAMGCNPLAYTEITYWLQLIDLAEQNSNDGSFLLSKIGSEFGLIGILFFFYLTVYSVKKLFRLSYGSNSLDIMAVGWLAVVTIGGFVRTAGYFSGPVILGAFAFLVLQQRRRRQTLLRKHTEALSTAT